jgi:DNA-binding CsgD family transcriptional regulator
VKTPTGVGFESRVPISSADRQAVMDAAAVLQLRRAELAAAVAEGPVPGVEIAARGGSIGINRWMFREFHTWRQLLSTRPTGLPEHLRLSLPNNRIGVVNGLRMISVYDHNGLPDATRTLLAAERHGTYLISVCTVQMNIVDRRFALLYGPDIDGEATVMAVSDPGCLAAAWTYWHRVMSSAYPMADTPAVVGAQLSNRQRQIMALLAIDANDGSIAAALGVSVRTVRSDIAEVMRVLGVRSRFSIGARLHELTAASSGAAT